MRKIFSISVAVLLVVLMALPAFAIGSSSSSDTVVYPVVLFDSISFYDSTAFYTAPFPFNNGLTSTGISNFKYFDVDNYSEMEGYAGTALEDDGYYLVGEITLVGTTSFVLSGFNQVINVGAISDNFTIEYDLNDQRINNTVLEVEYYVKKLSSSGDRWIFETDTFSWTESYYPNQYIDVSYSFERLASAVGSNEIYIKSMTYTVNFRNVGVGTPKFDFVIGADEFPTPPSDFVLWSYMQDLTTSTQIVNPPSQNFDTMSWLVDSVDSFLNTEFFPNFSISKLIVLILVIGIVLWFITLLI